MDLARLLPKYDDIPQHFVRPSGTKIYKDENGVLFLVDKGERKPWRPHAYELAADDWGVVGEGEKAYMCCLNCVQCIVSDYHCKLHDDPPPPRHSLGNAWCDKFKPKE